MDGGSHRSRKTLVGAATAGVVGVAVLVPLALLTPMGRDRHAGPVGSPPSSSGRSGLPDVARIVCDEGGTHVLTPRIRPQTDGVHFGIDNRTGRQLAFTFRFGEGGGGGDNAMVGKTEIIRAEVPPGRVLVICFDFRGQNPVPKDPSQFAALDVIDEDGIWVSPNPDCAGAGGVSGILDYVSGANGEIGDPIDLTREHFKGLRTTDVIKRAGYPEQESPIIAVIRDGKTIATAEYSAAANGGWLLSVVTRCQDSGLVG